MVEKDEFRNKLLNLWEMHSGLYRERMKKFDEMRLADLLREAECETNCKPCKKHYLTRRMWDLYYRISRADLFCMQTREEAGAYLDSLGTLDKTALYYQLKDLVKSPDYIEFQDVLRDRYYRFKNPKKMKRLNQSYGVGGRYYAARISNKTQ